jgi:hypothetical protein
MGRHPQIGISLDSEMRARLERLANEANRSIAAEIRARIERTLAHDDADPRMRELVADIQTLAREVQSTTGLAWHAHPKANLAMAEAVRYTVTLHSPSLLEDEFDPYFGLAGDPWDRNRAGEPLTVGRTLARGLQTRKEQEVARQGFEAAREESARLSKVRGRRGRKKS